jgi:hypothetical protein
VPRYEFQLPITFNDGSPIPEELFTAVKEELLSRFDGFHILSPGSPAEGWWKSGSVLYRDDIHIYHVDTKEDENEFFQQYERVLEERFKQEKIWIMRLEARPI